MAPTILVVGATGNTGRSVVETLSKLLKTSSTFSGYRILALTRSVKSDTAQQFAKLPGVEVVEQNWVEITAGWLREHEVERAFIAPHNEPNHFAEESTFHLAALRAHVKYVVRISTTAANIRPDCDAYYPRTHWAIETMLSSPEFKALQWTSLQPNVFTPLYLSPAAQFYRQTGKQETLKLMASRDAPVGIVHPDDVGAFAAQLLLIQDSTIVEMIEERIGAKVENVRYKDMSFIDEWAAHTQQSRNVILSIKHAPETAWDGKCTAFTTSKEVLELAAPKHTPANVLPSLLEG